MTKLILVATILAPAAAHAGGYAIPNETARDLALSESAVADQHGAEAVLLNIAALAGIEGVDVSSSAEILVNRTEWTDPTLGEASITPTPTYPPAAAVSYGAKLDRGMAWGVGIGAGVPGGGQLQWPNGWPGQQAAQSVSQQDLVVGVGGAFQPVSWLKFGAGYQRHRVVEEVHQSINYLDHFGDAGLSLSGGGNSFNLGLQIDVPQFPLSIGVSYSGSADVTLEGNAHFTEVPQAFQPMIHDQGVTENITVPNKLFAGAAYEVMKDLKVMAAYSFERWSVYKSDTFVGSDGFTVSVPRNHNNANLIRIGGEWDKPSFFAPLVLRLGGLRSFSGQPTDTVSPSLSDANSWAISAGVGYHVSGGLRVDLGYQHAWFDAITATGMEAFPGTYKTSADLLSLGVSWRIH